MTQENIIVWNLEPFKTLLNDIEINIETAYKRKHKNAKPEQIQRLKSVVHTWQRYARALETFSNGS